MIVQESFLKKLKEFGLNSYEAKIWTALLSRGVATAGELADISNVPRSRSYDVLESLEKKGFIVMKIGKPIKYIAVPPEEVVERIKKRVKEEAENTAKLMDELKDSEVLKELSLLHNNGIETVEPSDLSGAIKGQNNIYEHYILMIKEAEEEIILVTSENGLKRKFPLLKKHLVKAAERGVSIKIAAPITKNNEDAAEELRSFADVRDLKHFKARFMVVDKKEVAFLITDDEETHPSYEVGVWVNTPMFASALAELFDLAWKGLKVKN